MPHNFVFNYKNPIIPDNKDYICSICNIRAFKLKNVFNLYSESNNLSGLGCLNENSITCEEFIIKKIIE